MPQDRSFRGPLSELNKLNSPTAVESYFYPSNLTTVTNHYVRFDANIFENSRFQAGIKGNFSPPVDAGLSKEGIEKLKLAIAGIAAAPVGGAQVTSAVLNNVFNGSTGGNTTAALNYLNSLPEGGSFYNAFAGLRGIGNKRTVSHLYLYTPDTVTFDYQNEWKTESLREQFGMLADGVSLMADFKAGNFGSAFITGAQGLSSAFGAGGIRSMIQTVSAMRGFPINPLTETLFRETVPRTFQFNFKLYPQTQQETDQIYNIVEQFAFHGAPEYATSEIGGFMIMPSTFDIKFMFLIRDDKGNAVEIENPWMRRISTCGLKSFSIDYSPDGAWQAMEDGSPRALTLALTFAELEVITKDRVKRGF